jgi:hypothetical protein
MYQRGRNVDSGFRLWHRLYYRCIKEDVIGDRLLAARIPHCNTSVNWSKYSKPWDVIFDYPDHGIAQFFVRDLPKELPKEISAGTKAKLHSFFPAHVPLELNYAHSEIWTFKEKQRIEKPKLPETVKKEFRAIMSDRSVILLRPKV